MNDTSPNLRQPLLRPPESRTWRWLCVGLCIVVLLAFYFMVSATNVPAHPGVDQNGYLFGGRMLLERGTGGYQPHLANSNPSDATSTTDPFAFVGRMWIGVDLGTANERYYPKYPLGYPALIAAACAIGGPPLAFEINPLAMTLALLFTFLLVREIAGSTLALMATVLLATLPATMQLANNPNSHATAMLFVTASMFFLFSWTRHGGAHRLMLAAFFAGYAATIRYTEGLLILPLLVALLTSFKPGMCDHPATGASRHYLRNTLTLLIAWFIPIAALLAYNLASFGTLTGYDPCNESTGFRLQYAADNYLTMLEQFSSRGFALFFPFAIAGLIALLRWNRRLAFILIAWTVPSITIYTFYYWAPDNTNALSYMRFFLTVIPGLFAAAFAMFAGLMEFSHDESLHLTLRRFWITISAALIAIATVLNLGQAIPDLLTDQVRRLALLDRTQAIESVAPPGSVIFSAETDIVHHLQFVSDYALYSTDIFNVRRIEAMGTVDPDEPTGFQPQRQLALYDLLKDKTPAELWTQARTIVLNAQREGHRTFVVEPLRVARNRPAPFSLQPLINAKGWSSQEVITWTNTTIGDRTPPTAAPVAPGLPGPRTAPPPRNTRRADPFANYRALRDTGRLIEILPPPPPQTPSTPKPLTS